MRKTVFLACSILLSSAAVAGGMTPTEVKFLNAASEATQAATEVTLGTLRQTNDALNLVSEAKGFLIENKGAVDIQDFTDLYTPLMDINKIQHFKKAIEERQSKTIFLSSLREASKPEHNCQVRAEDIHLKYGEEFKKVFVSCNSTVYGRNHWLSPTDRVVDVYYISLLNGRWGLSGFEFGLIKTYTEGVRQKLNNIKLSLNDKFI